MPKTEAFFIAKFVESLVHPDVIGSMEYETVYELVKDCESMSEAKSICEELSDVVAAMLDKIKDFPQPCVNCGKPVVYRRHDDEVVHEDPDEDPDYEDYGWVACNGGETEAEMPED